MKHELKIWPQYYARVSDRTKTFEVRENDRGFQRGDTVVLKEWIPPIDSTMPTEGRYTGNELTFEIGFVLPIDDRRVVFSLLRFID